MRSTHPLDLGSHSTKLRGVWVRHKVTGYVGYISHVERVRGEPPQVWVVYPPGKQADGNRIKTYSASSTSADNLVRLKRRRKKLG